MRITQPLRNLSVLSKLLLLVAIPVVLLVGVSTRDTTGLYADRLALLHEGSLVALGSPAEVLRPEILSEFYGVNVRIHTDDDGTVVVVPSRQR